MNELDVFSNRMGGNGGYRTVNVLSKEHPYVAPYWPNQSSGAGWEHSYINEFAHFLKCISEGRSVAPEGASFQDGYRNCEVMDAVAESVRTKKWVEVGR